MIEIDKKVTTKNDTSTRRRDRFYSPIVETPIEVLRTEIATPKKESIFDLKAEVSTMDVSSDLSKFDKYKATDLEKLFKEINVQTEQAQTTHKKVVNVSEELNEDFLNLTKMGTEISESTYIAKAPEQFVEKTASLTINLKGKLIIAVASVVLVCLMFLTIYNAFVISGLNKSIASLNGQIASEERVLKILEESYDKLTSEELLEIAKSQGLKPMDPSDTIHYTPASELIGSNANMETNWFDAIANFFAKLLGVSN